MKSFLERQSSIEKSSPSPRRAWIEMPLLSALSDVAAVALPTEGVD